MEICHPSEQNHSIAYCSENEIMQCREREQIIFFLPFSKQQIIIFVETKVREF